MIGIIDYGLGNLGSIHNMLRKIGEKSFISQSPVELERAEKLILPGVGSFDAGMHSITNAGLQEFLYREVIERKKNILGICLGMQLMLQGSEEGKENGLGWIVGKAERFTNDENNLRVPHMGWNNVEAVGNLKLMNGLDENARFYFVHSYMVKHTVDKSMVGLTEYGTDFVSIIELNNIFAVQFHPEKSHRFGMHLLKNFADLK